MEVGGSCDAPKRKASGRGLYACPVASEQSALEMQVLCWAQGICIITGFQRLAAVLLPGGGSQAGEPGGFLEEGMEEGEEMKKEGEDEA